MVCIMAAVMVMSVGCDKESISPIIPDGALPGLFSVSATQQVYFSQGNLQYQASTDTWRFAEHQYDYVGSDNRSISSTYSGWIDLFGWGTGSNPTLSSTSFEDYGTFMDWGCNAIINGGNTANLWRTLTRAEWYYLLEGRPNASSKFAAGNINGVGGLIILPDNWTQPSECAFTSGFAPDWTLNSYTLAQWEQMEDAGAVFLPAAGYRYGSNVNFVGYDGDYWSSTPSDEYGACSMYFDSSHLGASNYSSRNVGFSVRPVQDNLFIKTLNLVAWRSRR